MQGQSQSPRRKPTTHQNTGWARKAWHKQTNKRRWKHNLLGGATRFEQLLYHQYARRSHRAVRAKLQVAGSAMLATFRPLFSCMFAAAGATAPAACLPFCWAHRHRGGPSLGLRRVWGWLLSCWCWLLYVVCRDLCIVNDAEEKLHLICSSQNGVRSENPRSGDSCYRYVRRWP